MSDNRKFAIALIADDDCTHISPGYVVTYSIQGIDSPI